jgi:hypothetical protein
MEVLRTSERRVIVPFKIQSRDRYPERASSGGPSLLSKVRAKSGDNCHRVVRNMSNNCKSR